MGNLLIKNAKLYSMDGIDGEINDILISEDKIVKIGTIEESEYQGFKVIDAKKHIVTPGIVDPHCHIGMMESTIGWAGSDVNEITDPATPELRGIDAIKPQDECFIKALQAGVTTVCTGPGSANVIGGTFCALKTYGKTVEEKVIVVELAMKCALGENPKRCYGSSNKKPSTRMGSAAILREWLFKAKEYYNEKQKYLKSKDLDPKTPAPKFDFKLESLSRVFDGLLVKIHAHQQDDIETAIRIVKEFGLKASIEHTTDGGLIPELLKESGIGVIIGPTFGEKSKYELKNKSFETGKILYDNNVNFAIMTDHPIIPLENTLTQIGLFVKAGLPWIEALKCVTINAAKVVGLDYRVGSITSGKDADIVIWSGDPLHYLTKPLAVIINGNLVK
jgi:imidazolonepropionase-like amidohydrolase